MENENQQCKECSNGECKCVKSFHLTSRKAIPNWETHESWLLLALFILETAIFTS